MKLLDDYYNALNTLLNYFNVDGNGWNCLKGNCTIEDSRQNVWRYNEEDEELTYKPSENSDQFWVLYVYELLQGDEFTLVIPADFETGTEVESRAIVFSNERRLDK